MAAQHMQILNERNEEVSLLRAAEEASRVISAKPLGSLELEESDLVLAADPDLTVGEVVEQLHGRQCLAVFLPCTQAHPAAALVDVLHLLHWVAKRTPVGFNLSNLSQFFSSVSHLKFCDVALTLEVPLPPPQDLGASLGAALPAFAANLSHLVPLQPLPGGGPPAALSVLAVMRELHRGFQNGGLQRLAHVPVERMLGHHPPFGVVRSTDTVLAAMHQLHTKCTRHSALAVVSTTGMLEGCFSARDLAALYTGSVSVMTRVSDFLKTSSGPACVCTPATRLPELLHDMLRVKRHHAFVVDTRYVPIACVSMSDIISLLCDPSAFISPRHSA